MSRSDFSKRMKRLIQRECAFKHKESAVGKSLSQFKENMRQVEIACHKQLGEMRAWDKRFKQLQASNEKLKQCLCEEEERLRQAQLNIVLMQEEEQKRQATEVQQRRITLEKMDSLYNLKKATNALINFHALPERIQGVALCEKENTTQWIPFCIDPQRRTQKEIQDLIWQASQNSSVYNDSWERLFLYNLQSESEKRNQLEQNTLNIDEQH